MKGKKYTEEVKAFALTLQLYSNKAYEYVRKIFNLSLPHPRTLRSWYTKVAGDPGFTESAFSALKRHVENNRQNNKEIVCSLLLDEMAIRKHFRCQ